VKEPIIGMPFSLNERQKATRTVVDEHALNQSRWIVLTVSRGAMPYQVFSASPAGHSRVQSYCYLEAAQARFNGLVRRGKRT